MKRKPVLSLLLLLCLAVYLQPSFSDSTQNSFTLSQTLSSFDYKYGGDGARAPSTFDLNYRPLLDSKTSDASRPKAEGTVDTMMNFVDAPLIDIVWCGNNKNVIFMLTEKNTLYRSIDDGFTGHLLSSHLQKLGKNELAGEPGQVGTVSKILQNPADKNLLLIQGTQGVNWITEDCGASFKAMNQGRKVDQFQFHPTERTWLLASAWTVCEDFVGEPCRDYKELFVSKDLGQTWNFVANYVFQYAWAFLDFTFFRIPRDRIIISHDPTANGNQTRQAGWKSHLQVSYSDDFFNTSVPLVAGGNKFLLTSNFFFVVQANGAGEQDVTLLVGSPLEKKYKLRPIEIPAKRILDYGYTILDTSENSVFLHIDHGGSKDPYGNLYISDSTGVRYSQALKHNARDSNGQCDFQRVQGLDGIYLANVYDGEIVKKMQKMEMDDSFPFQQGGNKKTSEEAYKHSDHYIADQNVNVFSQSGDSKRILENYKKTQISFDKGSIWRSLTPPEKDVFGQKIACAIEQTCSLHLHSLSNTEFGPFYSTANSLGLILGTGNVGDYLSNKPEEVNTYLSRDAGKTWFEIAKGSHIYEIGDHGGIIVIAPDQYATKEVHYTWDEGITWETLVISETPVEVTNILIEPSNTGEKFIIYGREQNGLRGIVVAIDFSSLHQRICQLSEKPNTPESDYETWTPNGDISPNCLMGRQVTFIRRKRDAKCFNNEASDRWKSFKTCLCTEDDFECDYGFVRQGKGPCLPMDEKIRNETMSQPEECDGYYYITQGYRKVAGSYCSGGIIHNPIKIPCPGTVKFDIKSFSFQLLVVISVGMLLFAWLSNKQTLEKAKGLSQSLKSKIKKLFCKSPKDQRKLAKLPTTLKDDEETASRLIFEDHEETNEQKGEAINLVEVPQSTRIDGDYFADEFQDVKGYDDTDDYY